MAVKSAQSTHWVCSGAVVFPAWLLSSTCSQTRKPQYFNLHSLEQLVSSWPVKHGVLQGPSVTLSQFSASLTAGTGREPSRSAARPSGSERIFIILRHSWAVKLYSTNNTTQLFARSSSPPQFHRVLPLAENTCDIFICKMLLDKLPVYLPTLFYPNNYQLWSSRSLLLSVLVDLTELDMGLPSWKT